LFEVKSVAAGSVAEKHKIRAGERIVSINGEPLIDYIDYVYFSAQKKLSIVVETGYRPRTIRMKKSEDEPLGLEFTEEMLGKKRVCANKCLFCFVDQLPRGMRKSLYVKDEDWRYSFVMGNYVTLSSIDEGELRRIIKRRVSPLFISVHTVDEALRKRMVGNSHAMPVRPLLKRLAAGRIRFHTQAVICPGMNDGEKLTETISFLKRLHPAAMSLAVVPVGLTEHRKGLPEVKAVTKEMAQTAVAEVEKWQKESLNEIGTRFVFAADEYYIKAELPLPPQTAYEAFDQLENGVGMMRLFLSEAAQALEGCGRMRRRVSIATGVDAAPFIKELADEAAKECGGEIDVYTVDNQTFGRSVTVAGLLGGADFARALKGKPLGDVLLISADALKDGEVFIDNVTLEELQKALGVRVLPIRGGDALIAALTE